ncbi:MAG: dihydrofolate reductase family protein [Hyphomicrobiaceae bacterium]|nr:dihydrofolate reductase family protein [Hyphomicrobiaceae bacterium]
MPGRNPARVIIDPNSKLPRSALCLQPNEARCIIVRGTVNDEKASITTHEHYEILRIPLLRGCLSPSLIVKQLFAIGLRRILVEGGATTVSTFIDADAVDRLHILVAPVILGSGKLGLQLKPITKLSDAYRPSTSTYFLGSGEILFDCNLKKTV